MGIAWLGKALRNVRANAGRSVWNAPAFGAPESLKLTSASFVDGAALPLFSAGPGVGANMSPEFRWTGVPVATKNLVLVMEDVDVPMASPLVHTIAILAAETSGIGEGRLVPSNPDISFVPTMLASGGYSGPRPVPGHGAHHYGFYLLAVDVHVPARVKGMHELLPLLAGHVLARGRLGGTYLRD